ncbi:MAG: ASCH domain-containing protein [Phycisphaerae bacterium]|nr:ASCH domain-containing protein [Phycisphaerae bacterium]|tara:strand:+ start:1792 stop:2310 length:519 start_codon:yes stop_codon:yes gene_type:complete
MIPNRKSPAIQDFIDRFLKSSGRSDINPDDIVVDVFGDSPELQDQLLALVLAGTKTATCTDLWSWEKEQDSPIEPSMLTLALDGSGTPRCIIETIKVQQTTYENVTAEFARAEGEHEPLDLPDEQVLQNWRTYHWAYYSRVLPAIGHEPSLDMPVLCEHFEVIYSEELPPQS